MLTARRQTQMIVLLTLAGCGGDKPSEPAKVQYPDVAGLYTLTTDYFADEAVGRALYQGTIRLEQPDSSTNTLQAIVNLNVSSGEVPLSSPITSMTMTRVHSATVDQARMVTVVVWTTLGETWTFTGSVSDSAFTGTHRFAFRGAIATAPFTARRRPLSTTWGPRAALPTAALAAARTAGAATFSRGEATRP